MRMGSLVLPGLLASGLASGQATLPAVEVRAGGFESVKVSCANPDSVTPKDVERVLSIDDPSTTSTLRRKLVHAASVACKAGIPHILITRGPNDTLSWKRME